MQNKIPNSYTNLQQKLISKYTYLSQLFLTYLECLKL